VPARNKVAAARFFADTFGLDFDEQQSVHFAPVRVNETLTLPFDEDTWFDSHHYAFHVSDAEFASIFGRIKKAGLSYGSAPWSPTTASSMTGMAAAAFFKDLNGHELEPMTVPQ
jgi:hypothetical protein